MVYVVSSLACSRVLQHAPRPWTNYLCRPLYCRCFILSRSTDPEFSQEPANFTASLYPTYATNTKSLDYLSLKSRNLTCPTQSTQHSHFQLSGVLERRHELSTDCQVEPTADPTPTQVASKGFGCVRGLRRALNGILSEFKRGARFQWGLRVFRVFEIWDVNIITWGSA